MLPWVRGANGRKGIDRAINYRDVTLGKVINYQPVVVSGHFLPTYCTVYHNEVGR